MTPESQRLVRDSFAKVAPIAPAAAAMFYDRLFTLDPTLRPLFKGDMQEQGLGDDFTPDTRAAWIECYTILAGTMQEAAAAA